LRPCGTCWTYWPRNGGVSTGYSLRASGSCWADRTLRTLRAWNCGRSSRCSLRADWPRWAGRPRWTSRAWDCGVSSGWPWRACFPLWTLRPCRSLLSREHRDDLDVLLCCDIDHLRTKVTHLHRDDLDTLVVLNVDYLDRVMVNYDNRLALARLNDDCSHRRATGMTTESVTSPVTTTSP